MAKHKSSDNPPADPSRPTLDLGDVRSGVPTKGIIPFDALREISAQEDQEGIVPTDPPTEPTTEPHDMAHSEESSETPVSIRFDMAPQNAQRSHWEQEEQLRHIERQLGVRPKPKKCSAPPPEVRRRIVRIDQAHPETPTSGRDRMLRLKRLEEQAAEAQAATSREPEQARTPGLQPDEPTHDAGSFRSVLISVGATALVCGLAVSLWALADPAQASLIRVGVPFATAGGACLTIVAGMAVWNRIARRSRTTRKEKQMLRLLEQFDEVGRQAEQEASSPDATAQRRLDAPQESDPVAMLERLREQIAMLAKQIESQHEHRP